MILKTIATVALFYFLTGCSTMEIEDFTSTKPEFIPEEYFNGKLIAYGIVTDSSVKIVRSFKGEL